MARTQKGKNAPKGLHRFFLRGLITVLPVLLTLVVFGLVLQGLNRYVVAPINSAIYWSLEHNSLGWAALAELGIDPIAPEYLDDARLSIELKDLSRRSGVGSPEFQDALAQHREKNKGFFRDFDELAINDARLRSDVSAAVHPLVGVLVSILLVVWLGWLVGGFVGRKLIQRFDSALHVIPIVKSVYPYSKQLVDFFFADKKIEFDTVVAVPYPSPGIWSLGFVTSSSLKTLRKATGHDLISCFVPSSPMPMTGYTVFIERSKVIALPITVDEALRVTMTGGVLIPPHERVRGAEDAPVLAHEKEMEEGASKQS